MFAKYSVGAQRAAPALARHLLCPKTTLYSAGINKLRLLALLVGLLSWPLLAEERRTFEGTLVDSRCYLIDNDLTYNYHFPGKKCGTMCLNNGTPGGLLAEDKKFYIIIAPSPSLAKHVGSAIRVRGTLHDSAILAGSVAVKVGEDWKKVELRNMM